MAIGVLVDANVLFSRTLRDWLFLLKYESSTIDLFRAYTSEDILAEVVHSYRRHRPDAPGRLTKALRDRIVESIDDVVSDFEVDGSYAGEDANDAHVHAATLACKAAILLTDDDGFVPLTGAQSADLPYEVHTADSFFVLVDDSTPAIVRSVTSQQYEYWSGRPTTKALDHALKQAGCPRFANRVAAHLVNLGLRAI